MPLVIETGDIVADANSYATVEQIRQYAQDRGITVLPETDTEIEQLAIRAMDWLEAQETELQGTRTSPTQSLSWPRSYVRFDGEYVEGIPANLIKAQAEIAIALARGVNLLPTISRAPVRSEKIGPISRSFDLSRNSGQVPVLTAVEKLLGPFYAHAGGLKVVRT